MSAITVALGGFVIDEVEPRDLCQLGEALAAIQSEAREPSEKDVDVLSARVRYLEPFEARENERLADGLYGDGGSVTGMLQAELSGAIQARDQALKEMQFAQKQIDGLDAALKDRDRELDKMRMRLADLRLKIMARAKPFRNGRRKK